LLKLNYQKQKMRMRKQRQQLTSHPPIVWTGFEKLPYQDFLLVAKELKLPNVITAINLRGELLETWAVADENVMEKFQLISKENHFVNIEPLDELLKRESTSESISTL
jgi:hypothetical protein